jgi:hypothetical protein
VSKDAYFFLNYLHRAIALALLDNLVKAIALLVYASSFSVAVSFSGADFASSAAGGSP